MLISCVCVRVCVCACVCVGDVYLGHVQIKTLNIFHCVILNVAHQAFFRE